MLATTVALARSTATTTLPWLPTYAVLPSGVIRTATAGWASGVSGIGVPATFVAVSIGIRVFAVGLTAYTVFPSGVIAIPRLVELPPPIVTEGPTTPVPVSMRVTAVPART